MIEADQLKRNTHKAFKIEFSSFEDYEKFLERQHLQFQLNDQTKTK